MRRIRLIWFVFLILCLAGCAGIPDQEIDEQRAAEANAGLGADFLRKNENAEAQSRFRRALGYDSDNVTANWGMAVVHQRLGEVDKARDYYRKTLDLQPGPAIYNSYAVFLCEQGDVDPAVEYFQRAANEPHYAGAPDALANAGLCLHRAGQLDEAERYYRDALAADGSQITALVQMARLQYERQEYLRARAFIERADSSAELKAEQLVLGARIELALGDREAAASYLERYNATRPSETLSLRQLEQSR